MKWLVSSGPLGYWWGTYEPEIQQLFRKMIRPGSVLVDVGANVGFYSLLASKLVGNKGQVYAIEPFPRNVKILERHLQLNHIPNVTVFALAVSDACGMRGFLEGENPSVGHLGEANTSTVETVTLDSLLEQGLILPPQFIKMDIEGEERSALSGAERLLLRYHPTLFLSTHGYVLDNECSSFLSPLGYKLEKVKDGFVDGFYEVLAVWD
ncbi:MAG: FkbM family methyltransferase [Acidobacteriia bacterium]|nr:FkbM family methyltransferase [Terriglobia bacterium]